MENEKTALLSPESVDVINQARNFMENATFEIQIANTEQRANAVTLGNELQKRYSTIEKQRKAEKSVWDEKAKTVQNEFKPVLDLLTEKKSLLARSIVKFDTELEQKRIAAQAKADAEAARTLEKLEAAAGTSKEKALALLTEANRILEDAKKLSGDEYDAAIRQVNRLRKRADEWNAKAAVKVEQARATVPEIVPQTAQRVAGERKKRELIYLVKDLYAFIDYSVKQRCAEAYLDVNIARLKKTDGLIQFPGIEITERKGVSFTGR